MSAAIERRPSPNQGPRPRGLPVDMLVLHYTGMHSAEAAVARLCDRGAEVSSHYVVNEDGRILCLVDEERRAAHAGVSYWRGHEALNDRSVGIEIVNPGHEWGYRTYPEPQIEALEALCLRIIARHPIPSRNVVGHSDVAPDRKQDPGELFPWRRLASRGIGLWPVIAGDPDDPAPVAGEPIILVRRRLHEIGYRIDPSGHSGEELAIVLTAFQRHWRQSLVNGVADRGTWRTLEALAG